MRTAQAGAQLVVVGLDHTTAPIHLRERIAFADSEVPVALARLTDPDDPLLEQAAILSTCNPGRGVRRRDQLEQAVAHRGGTHPHPLLLIDLATPRDVDRAAAGVTGIEVYTIDDLQPVVERTLTQRSAELPAAYSVVRAEVARFTRWRLERASRTSAP